MIRKPLLIAALSALSYPIHAVSVVSVTADALSDTEVRVTWTASDDDTSYYNLYQDSQLLLSGIEQPGQDVVDLDPDTFYQFFVTACDASGVCSPASLQADVTTLPMSDRSPLGQCEPATDGSAPRVALADNGDGTARLSWCEVTGAEGYNLFLNNAYQSTVDAMTWSVIVDYNGSEQYQVAWYADGLYPAKSDIASIPEPDTEADMLARLEAGSSASADDVEIYFTRHAEKMTQLAEQEDGSFIEVCGESKCAEVLNAKGELRAELLAERFSEAGITARLTHAFSSHKTRTRQTIERIVSEAGLSGDIDKFPDDGIQEFPISNADGSANATELDPEGTSASEAPVIEALSSLPAGSVALIAGHSGTLYDIMSGLGLNDVCLATTVETCDQDRYPIDEDVKVKNYGDIWKITLEDGVADFVYRVNLQPVELSIQELAR